MKNAIIQMMCMVMSVALTGCVTSRQTSESVPTLAPDYNCVHTVGEIVIDGKLNEPTWQKAIVIDTFYAYRPEDAEYLSPTKARLAWDKDNLYVAIECADDDVWSYSEKNDSELWRGDVAEFFVMPDTTSLAYCEFVVAPGGALYDGRYSSRGSGGFYRFVTWQSGANVATIINGTDGDDKDDDTGYTVEMSIPLSKISGKAKPPVVGDTWTFGVFRYDYSKSFESALLLMSIPKSERGFHYYEGYTPLVFKQ